MEHAILNGERRAGKAGPRLRRLLAGVVMGLATVVPAAPVSGIEYLPEVIALPPGWLPEGIAAGRGTTLYSGSRASGDILAVDVLTGQTRIAVDAPPGRTAIGIEQDRRGRFFVAGGATGQIYVYNPDGSPLATYQVASPPTFINDVVVTWNAAWFTDSQRPVLYKIPIAPTGELGPVETVPLSGDYHHESGFNLNGIDATLDGRTLIAVQSNTGELYKIDASTGRATRIDLGGVALTAGDGLLLEGRRLYVVQNRLNRVAVVDLNRDFTAGTVVGYLTSPNFDVPTTIARFGHRFYLVNARFSTPPSPNTPYSMVAIPAPRR